jgi:hypothetical protein
LALFKKADRAFGELDADYALASKNDALAILRTFDSAECAADGRSFGVMR